MDANGNGGRFKAVVELVEQIPRDLLTVTSEDAVRLMGAVAAIRFIDEQQARHPDVKLGGSEWVGGHPLAVLRATLNKCDDQTALPNATELQFIDDPRFRDVLRVDLSSAHRALVHGEWKAGTVLAGSVIEATLLWVLQKFPPQAPRNAFNTADQKHRDRETADGRPASSFGTYSTDLSRWNFLQLVGVAEVKSLISETTAKAANLARGYRNLIHAAAAERKKAHCDIGTAHGAVGAMESVIADVGRFVTTQGATQGFP
jgi:hypothetical protein